MPVKILNKQGSLVQAWLLWRFAQEDLQALVIIYLPYALLSLFICWNIYKRIPFAFSLRIKHHPALFKLNSCFFFEIINKFIVIIFFA